MSIPEEWKQGEQLLDLQRHWSCCYPSEPPEVGAITAGLRVKEEEDRRYKNILGKKMRFMGKIRGEGDRRIVK